MDPFTFVPPWLVVLAAAMLVPFLPRAIGHALGVLSLGWVLVTAVLAEAGSHWAITLFGLFDVVLVDITGFSRALGFVFAVLGGAAVVYAYHSEAPRVTTALALSYAGTTFGVLFAGDWLTVIIFWELMAVTSTLLVWHYGGKAVRAGYRYALAHGIGGSLLLFAVTGHYVEAGSFLFAEAAMLHGGDVGSIVPGWPLYLAILGIGVNTGFIGLHTWLPDTYPRPHFAASVFLSVFTTKSAAYVMFRALPEGGDITVAGTPASLLVAYMGGAMAVYGVVFALLQHDMRALLTYHIQAQVGYMLVGIGLGLYFGVDAGVAGGIAHAFNNVLFKALLFMAVGVVIYRTGINDLYELGGLWRQMPIAAGGFLLGALSITAIPGFNGFLSKGLIFDMADPGSAYIPGDGHQLIYWLLFIGAIGTFLSFIKLGYYVFLHGPYEGPELRDARPGQTVAMFSIGGLCLLTGLWWQGTLDLLPLTEATMDVAAPYSAAHLWDAVILLTISVVSFPVVRRILYRLGDVPDPMRIVPFGCYYVGKAGVFAVTESFAAIDRAGVALVRRCYGIGQEPVTHARQANAALPASLRPIPEDPGKHHIRAGIGTTVLLMVAVLTVFLVIL